MQPKVLESAVIESAELADSCSAFAPTGVMAP
jgi:hypothetical protein